MCYEYVYMYHSFFNCIFVPEDRWNSDYSNGFLYVCKTRSGNLATFMYCWLDLGKIFLVVL